MLSKMRLDLNKKEGFTLIELMIVVAILGVLAAVAIPQYMNYIATSKRRAAYENFESAKKGVMGEFARINGGNPARTEPALAAELNGQLLDALGAPDGGTPIFNWNPYQKGAKAAAIMGTTQYTNPAFLGGAVALIDGDVGLVFNAYDGNGEPVVGVSSVTITLLYTDENSNRLVPEAATITFE